MIARCRIAICLFVFVFVASVALADPPIRSGVKVGKRPGPYTSLVSVGPERGTSHCYICEAENKPVVIVFARSLSEPLGKLLQEIDSAVLKNKDAELQSWTTFLHEDQTVFDSQVVAFAKKHGIRQVPLGIYTDAVGPPTYLISKAADVTVLLSVNQSVQANFAFRTGELNEKAIREIVQTLPKITKAK